MTAVEKTESCLSYLFDAVRSTPIARAFVLGLVATFGIGVVQTDVFAQAKLPKTVLQPELWEKVEIAAPSECEATVKECARRFLEGANLLNGSRASFTVYRIGERDGRNLTIVFVSSKVNDDDSITGIRYRLAVSLGDVEDRSYKLETLGRQFTCARGHKNWSKARCP
jgi:hypothetical protein